MQANPSNRWSFRPWMLAAALCAAVAVGASLPFVLGAQNRASLGTGASQQPTERLQAEGANPTLGSLRAEGSSGNSSLRAEGTTPEVSSLTAEGEAPTPVLGAEGTNSTPPLLAQGADPNPPVMRETAPQQVRMPDDVRSWLEHLERIEKERNAMASAQLGEAMATLARLQADDISKLIEEDDPDPQQTADRHVNQRAARVAEDQEAIRRKWMDLLARYRAVPAPTECRTIASTYDPVLSETGAMILEITRAVRTAEQDRSKALGALMGMRGTSTGRIDQPARRTDGLVADICRKYETTKWFEIQSDVGSGVLSKLGW